MTKRDIALWIIAAQVASDSGKDLHSVLCSINEPEIRKAYASGYAVKDEFIMKAMNGIARMKDKSFRFFVTADAEGRADYIIYFDVRVNGVRHQVSFHSFGDFSKWVKSSTKSRGHWTDAHRNERTDNGRLKTESRSVCVQLAIEYGLKKPYKAYPSSHFDGQVNGIPMAIAQKRW